MCSKDLLWELEAESDRSVDVVWSGKSRSSTDGCHNFALTLRVGVIYISNFLSGDY